MGGGQIGYNWQYSPLIVLGLEADFQGALEKDSNTLTNPITASVPITLNGMFEGFSPVAATAVTDYTTKIEWFGTARVRIGYVWGNGNVMSYLTGGLAYGRVDIGGTSTISGHAGDTPFSVSQAFSHNDVNIGWVVGYGTEGLIDFWGARNWTWKVEGLWMDLGTIDTTGVITAASVQSSFFFPPTGGRSTRTPVSPTASFAPG
jgi:outer membrane immunogenic protein